MPHRTAVILVVGLSESLLGDHAPNLRRFVDAGRLRRLAPVLPAVTCSVQSSMLTGRTPSGHGIVGNGWYNHEQAEVQFWKQSNRLVHGEKVWDTARQRDPSVTTLNMFWWYNMYSSADWSVTPRPIYKADGRKLPDCYSNPSELRDELQRQLGPFPLFHFWGPATSIKSTQWIADATLIAHRKFDPTLTLVYLPHLDYGLQKLGPQHGDIPQHVAEVDRVFGELVDHFDTQGVRVVLVSEYGIEPVDDAVHVNRLLREEGGLRVRDEQGHELLDAGASRAFAVADHQIAHVYVEDDSDIASYEKFFSGVHGVEQVLPRDALRGVGLDHARSGDLVLVAEAGRWFSYDYWLDDARAPDFARTVDIHRKPGYDPLELFIDPKLSTPKLRIACKLLRKKLGFRTLMDVIPLDTKLVRGSHGRVDMPSDLQPVIASRETDLLTDADSPMPCMEVRDVILGHLFDEPSAS